MKDRTRSKLYVDLWHSTCIRTYAAVNDPDGYFRAYGVLRDLTRMTRTQCAMEFRDAFGKGGRDGDGSVPQPDVGRARPLPLPR